MLSERCRAARNPDIFVSDCIVDINQNTLGLTLGKAVT